MTGGNDREESLLVVVSREAIGVHDVAGIDFFLPLGGIQPLCPLPLGIPVNTKLVMYGPFWL